MEITVLDIQILKALHKEVKEVSLLISEMTAPYKALQQATKWLDQQKLANYSTSVNGLCRRIGQKVFLGQRKSIGKRISDYPKWSYLCRESDH